MQNNPPGHPDTDGVMPKIILRSLPARLGVVVVGLVLLYVTAVIWLSDGYGHGLQALAVAALVTVAVWLLWWRPLAVVADSALTVRNAWRTHVVPWGAVTETRTRWGLVLVTANGSVTVSAAQRGGTLATARREHREPVTREEYLTPSDKVFRTRMVADDAAHLLDLYGLARAEQHRLADRRRHRAERLAAHRGRDRREPVPEPSAPSPTVSSRLNLGSVVVSALAVLAVVLTTLLP